tara:strand:+ start:2068 stop:2175 length:108 start_codon:yes stop_codon:yes gene_type:complete
MLTENSFDFDLKLDYEINIDNFLKKPDLKTKFRRI